MNSVAEGVRRGLNATVNFLNKPPVKEGVKNIAGCISFAFGFVEMYDLYLIARGREVSTEAGALSPRWVRAAHKAIIVSAKISLILSGAVSRPGVFIISSLVGHFFSTAQVERVFGPNTIFAINPWHPRHVASIAAVILALPAVVQSVYKGCQWVYRRVCHEQMWSGSLWNRWLTDTKIRYMALLNTITSRPALHVGYRFCRTMLRV